MTDATDNHYAAVLQRLESLPRSSDQDVCIRRLMDAGMVPTTLDVAVPKRVAVGEMFAKEEHIIFRDRRNMRWVISRAGRMAISGRTEWEIPEHYAWTPPGVGA